MTLQAIAIGTPLAQWLARKRTSRIIARFETTLQLESEDGQWWAITTRNNPGAFRAVVPGLPEGQDFTLSYKSDALWDPRLRRCVLTMMEKQSAARDLARHLDAACFADAHGTWNIIADQWNAIACALRESDEKRLQATMARLIGCGTGLTPSGDDFAHALLVTLQTGDTRDRIASHALAHATAPHVSRTTRLSGAFLQEALRGWAFGALKDLLEALPILSSAAVEKLLRVGASSGMAYSLGVLMGLSYEFD